MMPSRQKRRDSGFTLLELIIATLIFSMVIAGMAVIYGTAFRQGLRTIQGADLRAMGAVASEKIQKELSQATLMTIPLAGAASNNLRGYTNATQANGALRNTMTPTSAFNAGQVGWFHFCVQTVDVGVCDADPPTGRGCLVAYSGGTGYPGPAVNAGNCGAAVGGGSTARVLSGWVLNTGAPVSSNYFSRNPADGVAERNQVRVNFRLFRPATQSTMFINYDVDRTLSMNFSEDNPS